MSLHACMHIVVDYHICIHCSFFSFSGVMLMKLYFYFFMLEIGGYFTCFISMHFGLFSCVLAHAMLLPETHTHARRKTFHYESVI
jgi:hypothetical protein